MATTCSVIQLLEPNAPTDLSTSADDHSLPVEEGGVINLQIGVTKYMVTFQQEKISDTYDFLEADVTNTVDPNPLELSWTITMRGKLGFEVQFNGLPDTVNYLFNWRVRVSSVLL